MSIENSCQVSLKLDLSNLSNVSIKGTRKTTYFMTRKKKKQIVTIKTSLKSVLVDNKDTTEFKENLDDMIKKLHLLRVGTQQFLHYYLVNGGERVINKKLIQAVLTVLNGVNSKKSSKFGDIYRELVPLVDKFLTDSGSQSFFPPSADKLDDRINEFVRGNPKPARMMEKKYLAIVTTCFKGNKANQTLKSHVQIYDKVQSYLDGIPNPKPLQPNYTTPFGYLATDILQNVTEMCKRQLPKKMLSFIRLKLAKTEKDDAKLIFDSLVKSESVSLNRSQKKLAAEIQKLLGLTKGKSLFKYAKAPWMLFKLSCMESQMLKKPPRWGFLPKTTSWIPGHIMIDNKVSNF